MTQKIPDPQKIQATPSYKRIRKALCPFTGLAFTPKNAREELDEIARNIAETIRDLKVPA